MIDAEKTKVAKEWILQLANGVNPLNNAPLNDSDIVNDVHISRCLFYVAEVLESSMQVKKSHAEKRYECEFHLAAGESEHVTLYEQTGISLFVREINRVIPPNMRPISVNQVQQWLLKEGYISEVVLPDNKKTKQATEKGKEIGISSDWKEGQGGRQYYATSYTQEAQKFLLANINLMVE
ncbi:MAG: hypothetical protein KBS77_05580 [Bacteroidales bacterium]|nr:hypothetical protein [Candidatus Colicola faecequi]